jgi:hypothetical protein
MSPVCVRVCVAGVCVCRQCGWLSGQTYTPRDPDCQDYEEAVTLDPIALCHSIICAVRASGQRLDHFASIIRDGNEKGWFISPNRQIIKVPQLQLLRDVKTRWDSIYFMIRRCREMRPVCNLRLLTTICTSAHSE